MSRSHIRSTTATAVLLFFATFSAALEVSPGSPCASKCLDDPRTGSVTDREDSLTFHSDLACFDWEYAGSNSTQAGRTFRDCQNCLKGSGYSETTWNERDTTSFLFNNRATVNWCIFGRFAEESNSDISKSTINRQCNSKCQAIYAAADYNIKSEPGSYDFCDNNGDFKSDADSCLTCLHDQPGLTVLGNILSTVVELCKQKPGKAITFLADTDIYATTQISFSSRLARRANSTSTSSSASNSTTPTASSSSTPRSSSGLSIGAIAGVVLGGLVGVGLILSGILLLLRRKKNKNKTTQPAGNNYSGRHQYGQVPQSYNHQTAEIPSPRMEFGGQGAPMELPARSVTPLGARRYGE